MTNNSWPFTPQWLSLRKGLKESEANPNFDGLFKPDLLRGFMTEAADFQDIRNPLSLFQVIPNDADFIYENSNERIKKVDTTVPYLKEILGERGIVRIDTGRLYKNKNCCDAFRKCKNGTCLQKCYDLDSRIALFYHPDLNSIHYKDNQIEYIKVFERICHEFNESIKKMPEHNHSPIVVKYSKHEFFQVYATYRCKYSGFDEYFFPVIVSGHVIAVIMQGQRPNEDLKPEYMFADYLNDPIPEVAEELRKSIDTRAFPDNFFGEESMSEERLVALHQFSAGLRKRANDAIISLAQKYVSRNFLKIGDNFHNLIKKIGEEYSNLPKYKQILNSTLKDIFETFNSDGFIRIYSIIPIVESDNKFIDTFELIGDSTCQEKNDDYRFMRFKSLPDDVNLQGENLINYLLSSNDDFKKELRAEGTIFRLEIPFVHDMAYIVWKKYDPWEKLFKEQYEQYCEALKSMYHTLLEPYIILRGKEFEDRLEKSIRISVHETAQVIPLITDTIQIELIEVKEIENWKLLQKKADDIKSKIELLDGLFNRSSLIFKDVKPKWAWTDFHRIVYGIESLFQKKAFENKKQYIQIDFPRVFSDYDINTDKNYITQILFNLVDNAIKYGLRGSRIYVRAYLKNELGSIIDDYEIENARWMCLSVENYGGRIEKELQGKMYYLFYRGNTYKRSTEGLGVGLFLVKRLCECLGYSIEFVPSEFIEQINLIILHHYKKQNGADAFNSIFSNRSLSFYNGRELDYRIKETVNMCDNFNWIITYDEAKYLLNKEMYKNKFEVKILINKNLKKKEDGK
ncbi:sensor histidine kinase [Bacteroides thetaiotaomicron]|jgi:hypothetical protein|uniref:histidine kinase n=1 Tax=Bacteroides thetaiotaomicron TaxID=818 RepID=A0A174UN56_BACT4|nr:ATP-binding protein [Bacteroides thetaiotaomicron]CUQ23883.1 PAS domain S-box [Bacteroides thetaiotaomicron]